MRELSSPIHPWTYAILVAVLSPLAAYFGSLWGWTPGAASLAIFAVPTCAAALSGQRSAMLLTALLSSAGCYAEVMLVRVMTDAESDFILPLVATCAFFGSGALVSAAAGFLRQRVARLEDQNTQYVRRLYEQERANEGRDGTQAGISADLGCDTDTVNFAMLLLTLQDVGRRVAMNLDSEGLFETIVSASQASLLCSRCRVYLWDAQQGVLVSPAPLAAQQADVPVPNPGRGMAGWVVEHRQILTRSAAEADYALRPILEEETNPPDAIAPLTVGGELLGLLTVEGVECESSTFMRLLYILADIYALGIKNSQLFQHIEEMARRDGLTGLLNHAAFQGDLRALFEAAEASGQPLGLVVGDIDHFKRINDTYGHQAGDYVLCEIARVWKAVVPEGAICGRYGGEEFICALPNNDSERAEELAEALRAHIEEHPFDWHGRQVKVTSSFGAADTRVAASVEELIRAADQSLYLAKQGGRNRVVRSRERVQAGGLVTAGASDSAGARE